MNLRTYACIYLHFSFGAKDKSEFVWLLHHLWVMKKKQDFEIHIE
jgi:hypothetical protein